MRYIRHINKEKIPELGRYRKLRTMLRKWYRCTLIQSIVNLQRNPASPRKSIRNKLHPTVQSIDAQASTPYAISYSTRYTASYEVINNVAECKILLDARTSTSRRSLVNMSMLVYRVRRVRFSSFTGIDQWPSSTSMRILLDRNPRGLYELTLVFLLPSDTCDGA